MITPTLRFAGSPAALALLILAGAPVAALAETITFRNDAPLTIVVQLTSVVRGTVVRERPATLGPNEVVRTDTPGNKIVTISEARKPTNVLFQGTISAGNEDLYLLIKSDPLAPGRLKLERVRGPFAKP